MYEALSSEGQVTCMRLCQSEGQVTCMRLCQSEGQVTQALSFLRDR